MAVRPCVVRWQDLAETFMQNLVGPDSILCRLSRRPRRVFCARVVHDQPQRSLPSQQVV